MFSFAVSFGFVSFTFLALVWEEESLSVLPPVADDLAKLDFEDDPGTDFMGGGISSFGDGVVTSFATFPGLSAGVGRRRRAVGGVGFPLPGPLPPELDDILL